MRLAAFALACAAVGLAVPLVPADEPAPLYFTDIAASTGLLFEHPPWGAQYHYVDIMGSGVCLLDYDRDGFLDVYFVQQQLPVQGWAGAHVFPSALYRNTGSLFLDVTWEAGVGFRGHGMGCAAADYDNDGDPDLYVTSLGRDVLYRNEGDGTFSDATAEAGVSDDWWSTSAAWVDFDRDGFLDLLVANYVQFDPMRDMLEPGGPYFYAGVRNPAYRNDGDGTFTDLAASRTVGAPPQFSKSLGVAVADVDGDGDPDWAIANDSTGNEMMVNEGASSVNRSAELGLSDTRMSMGIEWADFDRDLDPDLVYTNFLDEGHGLMRNDGTSFTDVAVAAGIGTSFDRIAWGVEAEDFDLDGRLDLAIATGTMFLFEHGIDGPTYLYRNVGAAGQIRFADATAAAGDASAPRTTRGLAAGDLDNDGDADLVVANTNGQPAQLLRNDSPRGHWLGAKLVGTTTNRDGLGAKVLVTTAAGTQVREASSGGSYLSDGDHRLLFGLGEATAANVAIAWPSGVVDAYANVPADGYRTFTEGVAYE